MAMFSKDVKNILYTLAILLILYGAYKALFNIQEGKRGGKRRERKSKKRAQRKCAKKDKTRSRVVSFKKNGKKRWKCHTCSSGKIAKRVGRKVKCVSSGGSSGGSIKKCGIKTLAGGTDNSLCEPDGNGVFPLKIPAKHATAKNGTEVTAADVCAYASESVQDLMNVLTDDTSQIQLTDPDSFIDDLGKANNCCPHADKSLC